MKLPEDQQQLKGLLQQTITLLCKNGLNYSTEFSVEALIVVTLDQSKIFHTNIKETVAKEADSETDVVEEDTQKKRKTSTPRKRPHTDHCADVPPKKGKHILDDNSHAEFPTDKQPLLTTNNQQIKSESDSISEHSGEIILIKEEKNDLVDYDTQLGRNSTSLIPGEHISEAEFAATSGNNMVGHITHGYWPGKKMNDGSFSNICGDRSETSQTDESFTGYNIRPKITHLAGKSNFYFCPICMLSFAHKRSLTRHMKAMHTGNGERMKFKCEECDKTYTRRDNLRSHMRLMHKVATQKKDKSYREIEDETQDYIVLGKVDNNMEEEDTNCDPILQGDQSDTVENISMSHEALESTKMDPEFFL